MPINFKRRTLLKASGFALGARVLSSLPALSAKAPSPPAASAAPLVHLSLNENSYGPSPRLAEAIHREFIRLNRYAEAEAAQRLAGQIAAHEHLPVEQVVLGEILGLLGIVLAS